MNFFTTLFSWFFPELRLYIGGGGGSAPKQPDKTTQTVINVPPYAQPYVESLLGRTQALTTGAQYEPYDPSQRFAGLDPMQEQSYQRVQNMGASPELDQAGQWVNQAMQQAGQTSQWADPLMFQSLGYGAQAAGAGNQFTQNVTDPGTVQNFMSPYMQNVVDAQKQEAIRDYRSQLPHLQASATRAGGLGGSRHAIMEAEGQRNLQQQLGDIQARGTQAAYDQALNQMQFGSQLGLQGLQTGLQSVGQGIDAAQLGIAGAGQQMQGAGILGQLGQTRFGQEMGIAEMLNAMGSQRQQHEQQIRDFDYQQFLDELNFPYQQLAFMSDMTQGLPLSQSTVYQNQAGPHPMSQLLGAGIGAYGLMNRAAGGRITKPTKKYAQGGQVDGQAFDNLSADETAAILEQLSDEQLHMYAQTVQDAVTLSLIQTEIQRRERLRTPKAHMPQTTVAQDVSAPQQPTAGLGAVPQTGMRIPNQVPQQVPPRSRMASGGIVALASGGTPRETIGLREMFGRVREGLPQVLEDQFGRYIPDWVRSAHKEYGGPALFQRIKGDLMSPVREAQGTDQPPGTSGPQIPDVAGQPYPALGAPDVATVDLVPEQEAAEAARQQEIYGPLEESVARGAQQPPTAQSAAPSASLRSVISPPEGSDAPQNFEEYIQAIDNRAKASLEEQMLVDAMRAGLDEREAQLAVRDNRGKMDALIAAGAAMMQGRTIGEGLALGAQAGVEALREATRAQDELEDGIRKALDEQRKYELALQKDNQKQAQDAYNNYLRYHQQNVQHAQNLELGLARIGATLEAARISASARSSDDEYRVWGMVETRLAATPEAARLKAAMANPYDETALAEAQRKYDETRRRMYNQSGIGHLLGDSQPTSSISTEGWGNLRME